MCFGCCRWLSLFTTTLIWKTQIIPSPPTLACQRTDHSSITRPGDTKSGVTWRTCLYTGGRLYRIYFFVEYKLAHAISCSASGHTILQSAVFIEYCRYSKACIVLPPLELGLILYCYLGVEASYTGGRLYGIYFFVEYKLARIIYCVRHLAIPYCYLQCSWNVVGILKLVLFYLFWN